MKVKSLTVLGFLTICIASCGYADVEEGGTQESLTIEKPKQEIQINKKQIQAVDFGFPASLLDGYKQQADCTWELAKVPVLLNNTDERDYHISFDYYKCPNVTLEFSSSKGSIFLAHTILHGGLTHVMPTGGTPMITIEKTHYEKTIEYLNSLFETSEQRELCTLDELSDGVYWVKNSRLRHIPSKDKPKIPYKVYDDPEVLAATIENASPELKEQILNYIENKRINAVCNQFPLAKYTTVKDGLLLKVAVGMSRDKIDLATLRFVMEE